MKQNYARKELEKERKETKDTGEDEEIDEEPADKNFQPDYLWVCKKSERLFICHPLRLTKYQEEEMKRTEKARHPADLTHTTTIPRERKSNKPTNGSTIETKPQPNNIQPAAINKSYLSDSHTQPTTSRASPKSKNNGLHDLDEDDDDDDSPPPKLHQEEAEEDEDDA